MVRIFRALLFVAFVFQNVWGADLTEEQERTAREIEGLLIAPCCWRQPVAVHFSPASDEVRAEIRKMIAAGSSRDEVLDRYVAEYGERILAKPTTEGFNALAYFLPFLFLVAGAGVAVIVIKKLRPQPAKAAVKEPRVKRKSKYSEQLDRELWG
jgi:cytochrome c-type biogenesis protein CcmH